MVTGAAGRSTLWAAAFAASKIASTSAGPIVASMVNSSPRRSIHRFTRSDCSGFMRVIPYLLLFCSRARRRSSGVSISSKLMLSSIGTSTHAN